MRRWRLMLELLEGLEPTAETLETRCHGPGKAPRLGGRMGLSDDDRRDLFEQGRIVAERSVDPKLLAHLVWSCGASYYFAGELREARTHFQEGVRIWGFHAGESDGSLARAEEAVEAAEVSTRYLHTYAWEGMGMACLLSGLPADAIRALDNAVAQVAEGVGGFQAPSILALLSASHAAAGDAQPHLTLPGGAVDAARARGARVYEGHALIRRALAGRLLGRQETPVAEDLELARRATTKPERTDSRRCWNEAGIPTRQ